MGFKRAAGAPMCDPMFAVFLLLLAFVMVVGSSLMLKGVAEAPEGFENEDGFHFLASNSGEMD